MGEGIFLTVSLFVSYDAVYLYWLIYLHMMSFRKSIIWIPPTSKELWDATCIYLTQGTYVLGCSYKLKFWHYPNYKTHKLLQFSNQKNYHCKCLCGCFGLHLRVHRPKDFEIWPPSISRTNLSQCQLYVTLHRLTWWIRVGWCINNIAV